MLEQYLTKEESNAIFGEGFASAMSEKKASPLSTILGLGAKGDAVLNILGTIGGGIGKLFSGAGKVITQLPGAALTTMGAGAATGVLGAMGYDLVKDQLTREDPDAKLNEKLERIYSNKTKELEDSEWITKVRSMRDELKRDAKKMSAKEYKTKYNALIDALKERSA